MRSNIFNPFSFKTDLVTIGSKYAIRRNKYFFGIYYGTDFLDVDRTTPMWRARDYDYFSQCLINNLADAKAKFEKCGSNYGMLVGENIVSYDEFIDISTAAQTDEGLADLLKQLKEFWILKKKGQ